MSINPQPISEPQEYLTLVEQFSWLVDAEMTKYEGILEAGDLNVVIENMPKLVSLVNTIGYLRGQDNAFEDRPHLESNKVLYEMEDAFEKRLNAMIDVIRSSDEKYLTWYRNKMDQYYMRTRGTQVPTDTILGGVNNNSLKKLIEDMK